MKRTVLLSMIVASFLSLSAEDTLRVLAIPGQNGLGSELAYVRIVLGRAIESSSVGTPRISPDFGQNRCMELLRRALNENKEGCIIHATSQGTATALNMVAHEDKGKKVKALILEAVLASGNSAIEHTVKGPFMNLRCLARLPFSYYWMPYIAKMAFFQTYWPFGKQPIKSVDKIPTDLPIIIAHSTRDPQLAYSDACAIYYGLCSKGNKNVYFITEESYRHLWLLDDKKEIIRAILLKHGLLTEATARTVAVDVSVYQPDHIPFKKYYDALIRREKNHERLAYASVAGVGATVLWVLRNLFQKNMLGSK